MRVIYAHATAEVPLSWLGRLLRRIPGVRWLFRTRAAQGPRLHFALVQAGEEISARVVHTGDQPLAVRISVGGTRD